MKRALALFIAVPLLLAACGGATAPATQAPAAQATAAQATQAPAAAAQPAQPIQTVFPTQAAAPAIQPTVSSLTTALPEFKPPQSGGVLNPPTIIPTLPGRSSVTTSGQQPPAGVWSTYRDPVSGLTFQYPRDWKTAIGRNGKGTVASLVAARPNQPITNTAAIVIDVRKKQGELLTWLGQQLPAGLLLIDSKALENPGSARSYNARAGNSQAVFLYAPAHGRLADVAELHLADNQYYYQVTYLGSTPDNLDNRAAFLHLLNTLTLTGTTASGVTLPVTTFVDGIDPARWK